MPFYEYRCLNGKCGYVQTVKASAPLTGKDLEALSCDKCHSHMEHKLSLFNINTGAQPETTDSVFTVGPNKVFVGKKIAERELKSPCGCLEAKCTLYEGRVAKQTELN